MSSCCLHCPVTIFSRIEPFLRQRVNFVVSNISPPTLRRNTSPVPCAFCSLACSCRAASSPESPKKLASLRSAAALQMVQMATSQVVEDRSEVDWVSVQEIGSVLFHSWGEGRLRVKHLGKHGGGINQKCLPGRAKLCPSHIEVDDSLNFPLIHLGLLVDVALAGLYFYLTDSDSCLILNIHYFLTQSFFPDPQSRLLMTKRFIMM